MKKIIIGIICVSIVGIVMCITYLNMNSNYKNIVNLLSDIGYKLEEINTENKESIDNFDKIESYSIDDEDILSLLSYSSYYKAKKDLISLSSPSSSWLATPHFFWRSRYIIIYLGNKEKLIEDLENILGNQFINESK